MSHCPVVLAVCADYVPLLVLDLDKIKTADQSPIITSSVVIYCNMVSISTG